MAGIPGRDPPGQRHLLLLAGTVSTGLAASSGICYRWRSSRRFCRLRLGLRPDPAGRPRVPRLGLEATAKSYWRISSGSSSKGQDYFFRGLDGLPAQPGWELLPPTNQSFRRRNKLVTSPYRHKALDFPLLADSGP
jgi:hypothetical protein